MVSKDNLGVDSPEGSYRSATLMNSMNNMNFGPRAERRETDFPRPPLVPETQIASIVLLPEFLMNDQLFTVLREPPIKNFHVVARDQNQPQENQPIKNHSGNRGTHLLLLSER